MMPLLYKDLSFYVEYLPKKTNIPEVENISFDLLLYTQILIL